MKKFCTGKKRTSSLPPKLGQDDDLALAGGPDDPAAEDAPDKEIKEQPAADAEEVKEGETASGDPDL